MKSEVNAVSFPLTICKAWRVIVCCAVGQPSTSYPALSGIIDPRDYLHDTSQEPLYSTERGLPVYPARPAIVQVLIASGRDAWSAYAGERHYQDIDTDLRAIRQRRHTIA